MANRWCDGLGRYGGNVAYMLNGSSGQAWAQVGIQFTLENTNPRTGAWHLQMGTTYSTAQLIRRVFGAPLTEVLLGFAMYCYSLPSVETNSGDTQNGLWICSLNDQSNNIQVKLYLGTDGALELRRGSTVLGRSAPIIGAGAYQHIEIYAKAGNGTDGAFEVRVDEVTKLNLTGIDTVQSANVEFSQFTIGNSINGATAAIDFADFFCNDTVADGSGCDSFIGDVKSAVRFVDADTAQADFAKSSGSVGYSLLNEAPPVDAGYISTAVSAAESDFGVGNGPANTSEILTARPFLRAWKDDAGTCLIAPSLKSGGVKAVVSDQPVTTAAAYYDSNVPFDPNTGVPWVAADLDAALEIAERTA